MWLSKQLSLQRAVEQEGTAADMGVTTIGGGSAAVETRGEQRDLEVFAPGGLVWQPRAGDTVLVIKGGVGCQERCVVAAETAQNGPEGLAPGELFLYSEGGASIYLRADGSIAVKGPVKLEGELSVKGPVSVEGSLTVKGPVSVEGESTLTGRVAVNGSLVINGMTCPACGLV